MPLDRMNAENPQTIVLIANRLADKHDEGRAGETTIVPGMLIETGTDGREVPHSTAGGHARKRFAKEDDFQGRTIADAYDEDGVVFIHDAQPGDWIWAFLANGEDVIKGALLESDGAGAFAAVTSGIPLVKAEEALDNDTGARARIRVSVL